MAADATPQLRDGSALTPMLEARSVAVVGASRKPDSLGEAMMSELLRGGYDGSIFPVNPGYDEVAGHRCYPSVSELPSAPDLAILGVANARIEQALSDAIAAGARSAVMFSSLYEEPEPGAPPLTQRLATLAEAAGIPLCGGNGMGFLNVERGLRATGFATPDVMRSGPVTFLSHSGSAFAALAFSDRSLGFNLVVSGGQEIVTTMDEYLAYALGLSSTRVVALLLETVRRPEALRAQLARALESGVAVIALKVGRTEGSKAMVTAHSGALAGEHGAFEALFDAYGVHEVRNLDEMADTLELFSSGRRVASGTGVASVHDSGGERALFVDLAADQGVPLARISEATRDGMQQILDPGVVAENPLDAWGTGIDADRIFRDAFLRLHDDAETAAMAFVVDLTRQGEPYDAGYLGVAVDVWSATGKPFCVLSNLASAVATEEAAWLRDREVPVLEGTESGLRALRHLLDDREVRDRRPVQRPDGVPPEVRDRWRARLAEGTAFTELEGLALLSDYGVPTVASRSAGSVAEAVGAAQELGWPVVLKTAEPSIQHKSDVGGVRLGIADADGLRIAYEEMATRLGHHVSVEALAPAGVEMALGIVRDAQFGPLVLVGAGGVLVELLADRRLALPPIDEAGAHRLIDGLRARPLLDGHRGATGANVTALVRCLVRLSCVAQDLGDRLEALDANPVIVSQNGCLAVDALVVPRA